MGRLDQAKGAIMEAEVLDEENPNVWVQYALYLSAIHEHDQATESLGKALMIDADNTAATVHLAQLFLTPSSNVSLLDPAGSEESVRREAIDMAAGMLDSFTRRAVGWNIPEAWYFLAKAVGLQGRKEKQRECLAMALKLEEGRPVRSLALALPACL
ncbi:hypothetical protein DL93DRAFT_1629420 [Clavulina sp. PMI_390]|nr:hypothetical protein DL93DRAFT_1629420 [Clavulina sp. PMI_390]